MPDVPTGQFTHTLEEIDASVNACANKQDKLTFDTAPTEGHTTQVVTSDGIFSEIYKTTTALASGENLDTLTAPGKYYAENATIAAGISNTPYTASGFYLIVEKVGDDIVQTLFSNTTTDSVCFKRLITTQSTGAWYSFSNDSLIAGITYGTGKEIVLDSVTANNDLDLFMTPGTYYSGSSTVSGGLAHCPFVNYGFRLEVRKVGTARYVQFIYPMTKQSTHYGEGMFFMRQYGTDSAWTAWYKFQGTAV